MAKAEIGWVGRTPEGEKKEVYAQHVGDRWIFYERPRRFERWVRLDEPPLDDWLELLDAVRRRVARRLLRPDEVDRLRRTIVERFPDAQV